MITKVDFIGIPSTDAERSRTFYLETLGLRPDENARFDAWAGDTCFGIWEPASFGFEFAPQKKAKGVEFMGDIMDTGVCHMALFTDPDGNDLMLHNRYKPYE
jgi:hypothetical protein